MLLSAYLEQWLEVFVVPFRAGNTVSGYRRAINALPASLLNTDLEQITGLQLQAAINAKAAEHPRAAQLVYTMLHAALGKAATGGKGLGLIQTNPCAACVKPLHKAAKQGVLNAQQLREYLRAARSERAFPLLALIAVCGLRRSEALGLTWSAIDLATGQIRITQQRLRVNHKYQVTGLKARSSYRNLAIPDDLGELLKPYRGLPRAFVVDITPEALAKAHDRCIAAAGVPRVTIHGLRHSMATIAAGNGAPIKLLQYTLGHSTYQLTADLYANHQGSADSIPVISRVFSSVI